MLFFQSFFAEKRGLGSIYNLEEEEEESRPALSIAVKHAGDYTAHEFKKNKKRFFDARLRTQSQVAENLP